MTSPAQRSEPSPPPSDSPTPDPDWDLLRRRAVELTARAYAPYSGVRVGAAALVDDGRVVAGCNVENASYGLSLCAECALVTHLVASGGGRLVALSVVGDDGTYLAPCGRCRQVLYEFGGPDLQVDTDRGVQSLGELLPGAFGPHDLPPSASAHSADTTPEEAP